MAKVQDVWEQCVLGVSFRFGWGSMSRTTQIHCNRCGDTILGGHTIIEAKQGQLATLHDEPIDLCASCTDRFNDWLKSGRQNAMASLETGPALKAG